ncbi:MAG: hypothetical protein KGJ02_03705 [Verrucomicrobiota bacterium]|nr:hypothetical protein [Verrucomicrobiota bacterium]
MANTVTQHPIHQYTPEQIARLNQIFQPGGASDVGFLAANESVVTVCDADDATLQKIGITYQQIADKLNAVMAKAKTISNHHLLVGQRNMPIIVEGRLKVEYLDNGLGSQECPFGDDAKGSLNYKVSHLQTRESFSFPQLGPHLIEEHNFFEGHTDYRMEPETMCRVLELKPGVNYKHSTVKEQRWTPSDHCGGINKEEIKVTQKFPQQELIHAVALAILLPYEHYDDYKYRECTIRERDILRKLPVDYTPAQYAAAVKEVDEMNALFDEEDSNKKCWEPGKESCHIFVAEDAEIPPGPLTVFGHPMEMPTLIKGDFRNRTVVPGFAQGTHVYELETVEEAVLDEPKT